MTYAARVDARSRIRGCLLAGAVGDALGAPVEFISLAEIRARFGAQGVTGYLPAYGRDGGAITDDTQMTLFTAEGVIRATVRYAHRGIAHGPSVLQRAYVRWLATQGEAPVPPDGQDGWLVHVEGLHHRRAPGNTCLAALRGGLTRLHDPFGLGTLVAAVTHGHPSGHLTAGFLARTLAGLVAGDGLERGARRRDGGAAKRRSRRSGSRRSSCATWSSRSPMTCWRATTGRASAASTRRSTTA
jgi:ADP-ribosyl-[dinitrogen reductase] hydrolase